MANSLLQSLNILGTQAAISDKPSYIEDLEEVLARNQQRALEELYALHGTIGPDPNYDEEGNIIPITGYPPDIALTPFMSIKSL